MYGAKTSGNRRSSRSYGGSYKSSSSRCGYTPRVRSERKSRERSYSRECNTSWEYGYGEGSGVSSRAPDPSMSMNHAMEFVNLDNYIANMFG